MQLRRFTADSTPAALGAVRQALGDDAIILANRKIGNQVEIIATGQMEDAQSLADISLDNVASSLRPDATQQRSLNGDVDQQRQTPAENSTGSTTIEELTAAIDAVEQQVQPLQLDRAMAVPTDSALDREPESSDATQHQSTRQAHSELLDKGGFADSESTQILPGSDADTVSLPSSSSLCDSAEAVRQALVAASIDNNTLQHEIQNLSVELDESATRHNKQLTEIIEAQSTMMNQYFKGLEVNLWGNNSPNRRQHLQRLFALGIGAEMAVQLVERTDPAHSLDEALRHSLALLKTSLPIGLDKTFSVPGVTILSGPPGAGKTTVLMKIATQHVKEHGSESIVIICADTRRIGAFEELQAYGRLLGVPTVHAHDSSELDSLLSAFTHKQLVLIDHTLPMDSDAMDIPTRLTSSAREDSVRQLLVLSATAQSATIDALIRRHCNGRSMQCVLTNLDANARLGEMFNALIRHHLPVAYWSDAASVQKPLQKADASVLVATAVAMSRRLSPTPDDEWLIRLIQPSDKMMSETMEEKSLHEVSV